MKQRVSRHDPLRTDSFSENGNDWKRGRLLILLDLSTAASAGGRSVRDCVQTGKTSLAAVGRKAAGGLLTGHVNSAAVVYKKEHDCVR